MKPLALLLYCLLFFASCRDRKIPDVSNIPVKLNVIRYEQELFALDTAQLEYSFQRLAEKHPAFAADFTVNILGLDENRMGKEAFFNALRKFLSDYRPIYDSVQLQFPDISRSVNEIESSLKFVRYYFPEYRIPGSFITYVGPMDAFFQASLGGYSDVLTVSGMASGLQLHLGASFSLYQSSIAQSLYPLYLTKRFTPETIAVNAMKNIIDELYPDQGPGLALIDQMVDKGKRLYVLDQVMPLTPDTLKIGYTQQQWSGCLGHEGAIWNFFITNGLLLKNDPALIRNYMTDGPKTPELGDASPGYIGLFVGWQIVKAYMKSHPETTPSGLLKIPARRVYEESKYRPK